MRNKVVIMICFVLNCLIFLHLRAQDKQTETPYSWTNLPKIAQPVFRTDTFSIIQFGAIGDGVMLNTNSINHAISSCSQKGGGVVLIPGGIWLTGPIEMKSNVNLHLLRDAILLFTKDFDKYPLVEGIYEGRSAARNQSPISGKNLVNIAITGRGVMDGNGDVWRMVGKDKLTESEWKQKVASGGSVSNDGKTWYPSPKTRLAHETKRTSTLEPGQTLKDFESIKDYLRPNLVVFYNCKKVLLEGVTFQNSAAWCLHQIMCEDLTVRNVLVKNPDYAQNGDGIDVESCKNVLIEGSTFDVGDDGICLKSGKDEEGRKRGIPTENVIIKNNVVYKGHGGFVIGSEMSGGVRNIFVSDCSFFGTDNGLRFKTARGRGGVVENIYIKNIRMNNIVHDAILFDMYYFVKPPAQNEKVEIPSVSVGTPQFRNFYISNLVCNGAERGIFIRGLPEMGVQNIVFENIILKTNKGAEIIEAADIRLTKVQLLSDKTEPIVYIENGRRISMDDIEYTLNSQLFLSLNGEKSGNIKLVNTSTSDRSNKVEFNHGAKSSMIEMK